jgi:hypothetical protein
MDIKKIIDSTPFLKGLSSTTHWAIYLAMLPFVLVLLGQAKPPASWLEFSYLSLQSVVFLVGAILVAWRDHGCDIKPEPPADVKP